MTVTWVSLGEVDPDDPTHCDATIYDIMWTI